MVLIVSQNRFLYRLYISIWRAKYRVSFSQIIVDYEFLIGIGTPVDYKLHSVSVRILITVPGVNENYHSTERV